MMWLDLGKPTMYVQKFIAYYNTHTQTLSRHSNKTAIDTQICFCWSCKVMKDKNKSCETTEAELKQGQHHWPGWPIDPDLTQFNKVEACAETYILGTNAWFCNLHYSIWMQATY